MRKDGMTYTEAKVLLNELRDKVVSGELEPEEALASVGLDNRFLMALQDWP
jgi:DNA-binding GntR family transcriptional regulator